MLLHGIFPPITTPFYPDGKVYFKKLEANVERYSRTPVAGIVVLGSTGEAIMLGDQERREVLKSAREATAPGKVLIAGGSSESAFDTLRLTEYAAELGYDVALVRTPHYYKKQMQAANILAFYRTVADRSPLPVMIYNVPSFTGYDIAAESVIELAEHPNVMGIKESGGDVEKVRKMVEGTRHIRRSATVTQTFEAVTPRMADAAVKKALEESRALVQVAAMLGSEAVDSSSPQIAGNTSTSSISSAARASSSAVSVMGSMKTRQKEVGFQVLVGTAQKLFPSLEAGAVGAILAFACPAPTACYEIYAAWKEGDKELSLLKQDRIAGASRRIVGEMGIAAVKYAMDFNGFYGGPPRLPLLPLTSEGKDEIERLLTDVRN